MQVFTWWPSQEGGQGAKRHLYLLPSLPLSGGRAAHQKTEWVMSFLVLSLQGAQKAEGRKAGKSGEWVSGQREVSLPRRSPTFQGA